MRLKGSGPYFQRSIPSLPHLRALQRMFARSSRDCTSSMSLSTTRRLSSGLRKSSMSVTSFPPPESISPHRHKRHFYNLLTLPITSAIMAPCDGPYPESIEAFEYCQQAISNCQELYFLKDTMTPILQTPKTMASAATSSQSLRQGPSDSILQ